MNLNDAYNPEDRLVAKIKELDANFSNKVVEIENFVKNFIEKVIVILNS